MSSSQKETPWKRTLRLNMKGQDVEALQRRLAELSYYSGKCDGVYGLLTKGAVFDFQKAHRLRVDGIAGKEVFSILRSGLEREKIEHIVAKGETLSGIAARYKVSEELLIRANSLEAEEVEEGDSLVIPVMRLFGFCSAEHLGEPVYPYEYVLRSLTAIAPRWFFLDENGSVHGSPDKKLLALTRMADIELWPVVNVPRHRFLEDGAWTQNPLACVLSDSVAYSSAIKGISNLAARMRTKGLIISVEEFPLKNIFAFQSFLCKLRKVLSQEGALLAVEIPLLYELSVSGKQIDRKRIHGLQDIASQTHLVFLRTYKYPWEFTSPEPVMSISRVRSLLQSFAGAIDFWKTVVSIPAFGVDFSSGLGTAPLRKTHGEVEEIIGLFKPVVSHPDGERSKVFKYRSFRVSHTLYFEDAESIGAYVDLVQRYGVAGIAIADLEDVDTRVWGALKVRFKPVRGGSGPVPNN
ncbi:MAG: peptidoglycan-binding protein [Bacillota bacterium]